MSLLKQLISSALSEKDEKKVIILEEPVKQEEFLTDNKFAKAERIIAAAERDAAQLLELERNEDGEL